MHQAHVEWFDQLTKFTTATKLALSEYRRISKVRLYAP